MAQCFNFFSHRYMYVKTLRGVTIGEKTGGFSGHMYVIGQPIRDVIHVVQFISSCKEL